jgi:hypothetical protein
MPLQIRVAYQEVRTRLTDLRTIHFAFVTSRLAETSGKLTSTHFTVSVGATTSLLGTEVYGYLLAYCPGFLSKFFLQSSEQK